MKGLWYPNIPNNRSYILLTILYWLNKRIDFFLTVILLMLAALVKEVRQGSDISILVKPNDHTQSHHSKRFYEKLEQ